MAITRITKGVIKPNENYDTHNIVSTGIITSVGADINGDLDVDGHTNLDNVSISGVTTFAGSVNNLVLSGVVTTTGLDVNGNADISGNMSVGGVLTYEDVTSIDSVGIITARNDIHVGAGVSAVGVGTFGAIKVGTGVTIEENGQATFVGVTTFGNVVGGAATSVVVNRDLVLRDAWGYGNHIKFHWGTNTLNFPSASTANIARVPNLSFGDRTNNGNQIGIGDFLLYHDHYNMHMRYYGANGNLVLSNKNTEIHISGANGSGNPQQSIRIKSGATEGVILHHGGDAKFETAGIGASVYGTLVATGADINGDLDVDGHTNLDNVSVAGVTTFAGNTFVNDSFAINDTGSSTPLSITGNFGTGDSVYIQNNTSGGHVRFGLRANDSDGNHHRAYITAERGTGATANGKLSILARRGNGTDFGWIIDSGVGIQANYNVIPETDSTHDLGTSSVRWANVYADTLDIGGNGTFGSSIYLADSIIHSGDTNTSIDYENDKISVKTGGTTRVSVANTGIILDDEVYIHQTSSGMPLRIEGMLGSTENILLRNNTSGGHIQIGFRQNDSDGNHHRAYIIAKKSATSGSANGQLELLARHGGGVHGGFVIDRGVGIKANLNIIPETDSTYDLGTSSIRWRDIYTDDLDVAGSLTATGADINGDLDVDGHTNLDNVSVAGVTTITAPNNTDGAFSITASNNAMPFSVVTSKSSGGIGTYLFKNSVGRFDFKFENTYNGNWYTGSTFHTRILWTAPNEIETTPEVCSIMPNTASAGAGGGLHSLEFKVTDNTSGLKRAYQMSHDQHSFWLNDNVQALVINSVTGVGVTSYIYHGYTGGQGDTNTRFGFASNHNIVFDTDGIERLRINNSSSTFAHNIIASADLDVDGHTNLDNVSVAGVSTFSGLVDCNGGARIDNIKLGVDTNEEISTQVGNLVLDSAGGTVNVTDNLSVTGDITGAGDFTLTDTATDSSAGPEFKLFRNSSSPADADYLGQIKFAGESDTGVERNYAKITGKILDASNGTEDGIIEFAHIKAGSQTITGRWRSDSLQLLNGTALTVAGSTTVTGNIIPSSDSATDIGTNGVRFANIYADTLYGDGSNLTGISGVTINNNADNRIITGSGTAATLNGEANITFDGTSLKLLDHKNIYLGTGNDLRIWHDANNSYSQISGQNHSLYIDGATTYMRTSDGSSGVENAIVMNSNGSVDLYHSGTKKFETYSSGVTVSGNQVNVNPSSGNANLQLKSGSGSVYQTISFKASDNTQISYITSWSGGTLFLNGTSLIRSSIAGTEITEVASTGFHPVTDSARDLGLNAKRWRNVYADTLYGDGSNLTGIVGVTINNNTDNRVATCTGTTGTLNGEANLTFNGSTLDVLGNTDGNVQASFTRANDPNFRIQFRNESSSNNSGESQGKFGLFYASNSADICGMQFLRGGSTGAGSLTFTTGGTERLRIDSVGQVLPGADDAQNLGSSTKRWKNIYAADMHFSNKGKTNDVDGTWGDWTLQEGEDSVYMINNRTGKKYAITMKEVN